ncbi:MAG: hypothetical protein WD043_12485 [Gemmatimonadales bacterium]
MARWLTPFRAVLVAVLGGLVLGIALRGERHDPRTVPLAIPETRGRTLLERQAQAAHLTWRTAVVVDSVRRRLPTLNAPVTVLVGPGVPPGQAAAARRGIERAWGRVPHAPGARTVVALVLDTAGLREWDRGRVLHLVPSRADEPCLTVIQLGPGQLRPARRSSDVTSHGDLPGLCGLVAQVGLPGNGIADWLHATRGVFTSHAVEYAGSWPLSAPLGMMAWRWELRSESGRTTASCLAGRAHACQNRLAGSQAPVEADRLRAATGLIASNQLGGNSSWWGGAWASGLLADQGPERFAAFWTSDQPITEAFQAAFERPLGRWTAEWLRARGAQAPRELRSVWPQAPVTILLALVFAGVALAYSTRRTASA